MAKPRVLTRQQKANSAAERWRRQYIIGLPPVWLDERKSVLHAALVALGPTPSPEAVDEVIGNDSWTALRCDGCGKQNCLAVVRVGSEKMDGPSSSLCVDCVTEAQCALEAETRTP